MAEKIKNATNAERETLLAAVSTAKDAFAIKQKTMESKRKVMETFRKAQREEDARRDTERQNEAKALFTRTKAQFDTEEKEFKEAKGAKETQQKEIDRTKKLYTDETDATKKALAKTAWEAEVTKMTNVVGKAFTRIKGTYDASKTKYDNGMKAVKVAEDAAKEKANNDARGVAETDLNKLKTTYDADKKQLDYWTNKKLYAVSNKEWEDADMKWRELKRSVDKSKAARDTKQTEFDKFDTEKKRTDKIKQDAADKVTAKQNYDKRVNDMKAAKDKFEAAETKFKDFKTKWDT